MHERRTYPGFLSKSEAARDRRRLEEMVKGFKQRNRISRIGETENFIVDYDSAGKTVLVYGKEIPRDSPFKLGFNETENNSIIEMLVKAKAYFQQP